MIHTAQVVVPDENGFDFDALLRANMERVFNERDPQRRMIALEGLWSADPVLYERDKAFAGTRAISGSIEALHALPPPGTVFMPTASAIGHHGAAVPRWRAGPPTGPAEGQAPTSPSWRTAGSAVPTSSSIPGRPERRSGSVNGDPS